MNPGQSSKSVHSRRIFLEKLAAGAAGLALSSASLPALAAASQTFLPDPSGFSGFPGQANLAGPFISDKKFVPVMLTPFTNDGKIDFETVSRLVDYYLSTGVKGFFANCLSSEMYSLSPEERLALTGHVVKHVNGRVPVVATGSFGDTLEERAEFTKKIYQTGIHAVILITSHFAAKEENDETLLANFEKFFKLTGNIPLGTYECPSPYKRLLTPAVFRSLLDTNRLIYHKDTSIDFSKVKAKLDLIKGNRIEFFDAHSPNAMNSLQAGAKGISSIAGNCYTEMLVWMCNHANDPKRQEEVKWVQSLLTTSDPIISSGYPLSAKYFMHKRGLPINLISRAGTKTLTAEQTRSLDDVYSQLKGWCERLSIQPVEYKA